MKTNEKITIVLFALLGIAYIILFWYLGNILIGTVINLGIWLVVHFFVNLCDNGIYWLNK